MTAPVFLVGARRSGTTLFRLMLGGHPQMVFQHRWEAVADACRALEEQGAGPVTVEIEEIGEITAASSEELRERIEAAATTLLKERGKSLLGATCHVDFLALHALWPSARFIHLLRDPRDVAISFHKLGWAGHYFFAGDGWARAERDWDRLAAQLASDQYLELSYEGLVIDPEAELTRICAFLDIPYDEALFSYTETSPYSYPKKELANRWKDQLSAQDLQLIESRIRPAMEARGYAPHSEPVQFSSVRVRLMGVQNRWRRRLRRIREDGPYYVLINMLARRVNVGFLNRRAADLQAERHAKHISGLEKGY